MKDQTRAFFHMLATGSPLLSDERSVKCQHCDGTGFGTCHDCRGIGKHSAKCDPCSSVTYNTCSTCRGGDYPCKRCNGNGSVMVPPAPLNHPADEWTIAALRKISINGSFT